MLNQQTKWRIDLAKGLFEKVKTIEELEACFIGGSVCRGMADEYSDLEICFVWGQKIDNTKRLLVNQKMEVKSFYLNHNESLQQVEESVNSNDFQIDIYHTSINVTNSVIEDVMLRHDFGFPKLIHLNVLQNAIPLHGELILKKWKEVIKEYPNEIMELIGQKIHPKFL